MTPPLDTTDPATIDAVRLRPADAADAVFLHAERRADHHAHGLAMGFSPALADTLAGQQASALERHLATHHGARASLAIVLADTVVGGVELDRTVTPWVLADILVAAAWRQRGVGTAAIRAIQREAALAGARIRLQVAHDNPGALALYRRLGFAGTAPTGPLHHDLSWPAPGRPDDAD